jgi:cytochrome P450
VLVPLRSVGGADSISTVMAWWILAMLAYPETQARAHAELDAVVGRARLPTFADYTHLPYIRAMVKEILRWRPVAPLGTPHRCTEDDWYEGMFIPKGTICIPNAWCMNHESEVYGKNAMHFDPGRYLDGTREISPGPSQEGHITYGFGRRKCVGRHLADNSFFINIAVLLWAIKIERKVDASGQLLPLDVDGFLDHGLVVSVDSSHIFKRILTWAVLQTTGPLRMRDRSALSRGFCPACTGT